MQIVSKTLLSIIIVGLMLTVSCGTNKSTTNKISQAEEIRVNNSANGQSVIITLGKGKYHNHPTFAIWLEDTDGNYIQDLFVTKSIATGIYGHGPLEAEKWDTKPGWQKRPAALPYWINRRKPMDDGPQLPDPEHPVPDALTGATPEGSAKIISKFNENMGNKVRVLMEVNQPWDWNEYWTNTLHDDPDYRTSCQPSLIYAVTVDLDYPDKEYYLNPIGHGHYSGKDGDLYTNLTTITTAREIFTKVHVEVD